MDESVLDHLTVKNSGHINLTFAGYHSEDDRKLVGILKKTPPNISLMNIEDPQFADSQYVLTSPRSLEACQRLSVKVSLCYTFNEKAELINK